MFALILLPFVFVILFIINHYLSELTFMLDAVGIFFSRLPDYFTWLPLPVYILLLFGFGVALFLRIWGRLS